MNIATSTVFFVTSLAFALQPALAASCSQLLAPFAKQMQLSGSAPQRDDCVCDKSLRNLKATLPKQMKLVAACGLRWNDGRKVNLSTQKASLDRYTDYYIFHGEIFITGTAKLSGPFTYEIGETEHVWLSPVPPLIDKGYDVPLANDLRSLYFDDKNIYERFYAFLSKSKIDSSCITSNATIEIDGIHLTISEGDDEGAFPVKFKVVSIGGFKPCAKR